jgi:hypothetical protein
MSTKAAVGTFDFVVRASKLVLDAPTSNEDGVAFVAGAADHRDMPARLTACQNGRALDDCLAHPVPREFEPCLVATLISAAAT